MSANYRWQVVQDQLRAELTAAQAENADLRRTMQEARVCAADLERQRDDARRRYYIEAQTRIAAEAQLADANDEIELKQAALEASWRTLGEEARNHRETRERPAATEAQLAAVHKAWAKRELCIPADQADMDAAAPVRAIISAGAQALLTHAPSPGAGTEGGGK